MTTQSALSESAAARGRYSQGPGDREYLGFQQASDPQFRNRAFFTQLRATATWAGGETVSLV